MTEVSVLVVDIAGGAMLRQCLDSIGAQTLAPLELIVHDNSERNIGFAAGVNAAYARSRGALIALVNNDAVLDADWLETVAGAMAEDPKLAAVQTVIRRDANSIDGAGIDIRDGTFRQIVDPAVPAWGVSATAALYRRAAVGERFFDERFF